MSEITRGVMGMPYEMAMCSEMSRRQFYAIAREVYAENESLRSDLGAETSKSNSMERLAVKRGQERDEMRKVLAQARLYVPPADPLRLLINATLISSPENHSQ